MKLASKVGCVKIVLGVFPIAYAFTGKQRQKIINPMAKINFILVRGNE